MRPLGVIGCAVGGALLGFVAGALWPQRGADDLGVGQAMSMVCGAFVGGFAGLVVGAVVFA